MKQGCQVLSGFLQAEQAKQTAPHVWQVAEDMEESRNAPDSVHLNDFKKLRGTLLRQQHTYRRTQVSIFVYRIAQPVNTGQVN